MNNLKIIKFESGLIGFPEIKSGYRFTWNNNKTKFDDILNFLCEQYGEGIVTHNSEKYYHVTSPDFGKQISNQWSMAYTKFNITKSISYVLVISDETILTQVMNVLNLCEDHIDYSQTIEYNIRRVLEKFLFKRITSKLIQKVKVEISITLKQLGFNIQWYNINIEDFSSICFNVNNTAYQFSLSRF